MTLLAKLCLRFAVALLVVPQAWAQSTAQSELHDSSHADRALVWCAVHLARKELVAALSDCNYAVERDPESAAAFSNRASVWLLAGEPKRALIDIEAALRLTPDDPALYYNRGLAYAKLGAGRKAIADYSEAIRRKSDFAIAYYNRGYEHERLGQIESAIADYRRALEITPNLAPALDALKRNLNGRIRP